MPEGLKLKPSLFTHAPKELSQDAFLNWLMAWADPACQAFDPALHACGQDFIVELIRKIHDGPVGPILKVETGRQRRNIDIWAEIETASQRFYIIIEDKTTSGERPDQLLTYLTREKKYQEENGFDVLVCIYLKTGNESRQNLSRIVARGFQMYTRKELRRLLERHADVRNDVYVDFKEHIGMLDDSFEAYAVLPPDEWKGRRQSACWQGFYMALDAALDTSIKPLDWGYAPNQTGGFWYAVVGGHDLGDRHHVYLQIEQDTLCFKISLPDDARPRARDIRNHWSHRILRHAEAGALHVKKPARFGLGKHMTFAQVAREHWLGSGSQTISLPDITARIGIYKNLLGSIL